MKYVLIIMVLFTSTCSYCINNNANDKEIILMNVRMFPN